MKNKRNSPFDKDYAPYGTYQGPRGSADQWRSSFSSAWNKATAQEIVGKDDPWTILGVQAGASKDEVKAAFRKLMKENHPDLAPAHLKAEATEKTKRIIAAYAVLGGKKLG